MEKWFVYNKKADFLALGRKLGVTPLTIRVLRNRDIPEEEMKAFLKGDMEHLHSPYEMMDMEKAAALLLEAMDDERKIRVVMDYDVDGCCSGAVLLTALTTCGADVDYDIPDRIKDGYGISRRIVEKAHQDGIGVLLTCDNGIAAREEIALAKSLGMVVIVTDHHDVPFTEENGERTYLLPEADAIVDAKRPDETYPFHYLCGAGVSFKLAQVLYEAMGISEEELYQLTEPVGIATICDIVELTGENRILAKEGLKRLQNTSWIGIKALIEACGLSDKMLSFYHIGFVLGPSINASGRLSTANKALDLLICKDEAKAAALAQELRELNDSRKSMTEKSVKKAVSIIDEGPIKKVIVVYVEDCHESVAGIVAGRIREKYHRPVIVLTDGGGGVKGSGRSIHGYNIFEALMADNVSSLLTRFGGHPMAAGLTLPKENIGLLTERLEEGCCLTEEDMLPRIDIDAAVPMSDITIPMIEELQRLEPFGKANPKPLFAERNLKVIRATVLGKNKNVLRLCLRDEKDRESNAIYFGDINSFFTAVSEKYGRQIAASLYRGGVGSCLMDFVYSPGINEYNGNRSIQMEIVAYR